MLRDYQILLSDLGTDTLRKYNLVYYAVEMRVGKTLIALQTAENVNAQNVLFVTKKKAIPSVQSDYEREAYDYSITVTNYEQLKNINADDAYDLIIVDEASVAGAFPKPSQRQVHMRKLAKRAKYVIYLSGTPCPESYSQLYHQFQISPHSPFPHKNFYEWAREYVTTRQIRLSAGRFATDYSKAKAEDVLRATDPYFVRYTQRDAGFTGGEIEETIIHIDPLTVTTRFANVLIKDKVYTYKSGKAVVCDTAVALLSKLHQVYSGTVILDDGSDHMFDMTKAEYIQKHYANKKIAIFYKFKAEEKILRAVFKHELHQTPEQFNAAKSGVYLSQIQSGSMGVNLSTADYLIFYNIDFSATSYWQARARIQALERKTPAAIHWLFTKGGIEDRIYKAVTDKKDYTTSMFKHDYHITN
jgi:hypothetical protein